MALLTFASAISLAISARADSPKVVSIEEHWELRLAEPDPDRSAPQTTMVMSPIGDLSGAHFLFTLNHNTVPDYAPGGVQVQFWNGEEFVQSRAAHDGVRWIARKKW